MPNKVNNEIIGPRLFGHASVLLPLGWSFGISRVKALPVF